MNIVFTLERRYCMRNSLTIAGFLQYNGGKLEEAENFTCVFVVYDLIFFTTDLRIVNNYSTIRCYNPFLVYCRELAPGTVSLTGDRAQGDDSKHDSHYRADLFLIFLSINHIFQSKQDLQEIIALC